jgi:hypothetical protein
MLASSAPAAAAALMMASTSRLLKVCLSVRLLVVEETFVVIVLPKMGRLFCFGKFLPFYHLSRRPCHERLYAWRLSKVA